MSCQHQDARNDLAIAPPITLAVELLRRRSNRLLFWRKVAAATGIYSMAKKRRARSAGAAPAMELYGVVGDTPDLVDNQGADVLGAGAGETFPFGGGGGLGSGHAQSLEKGGGSGGEYERRPLMGGATVRGSEAKLVNMSAGMAPEGAEVASWRDLMAPEVGQQRLLFMQWPLKSQ
jgi:hypothetical protein